MDEQKYIEITKKVMSDKSPLMVDIDIMSAWLLVSGLQLTVKHPALSEHMKKALTGLAHQFQARIIEVHPEAEELIEMGWNEAYDVDEDGEFVNACPHQNKMLFVSPTTGHIDLACNDCGEYIEHWDGLGEAPDWVPDELKPQKKHIRFSPAATFKLPKPGDDAG